MTLKLCPFRLVNIYNVMDYGAHADGTTDDVDHIQAAIDACSTAGGGVVFMPAGTYYIYAAHTVNADCGAMIELKNGVDLRGAGVGQTILYATRNNANLIASSEKSNIGVGKFTVNWMLTSDGGVDVCKMYASSRVSLYDLSVSGNSHALSGLSLTGCNDSTVTDCVAYNFRNVGIGVSCNALNLNNPDGLWCYNNTVTDCEAYGNARGFGIGGQSLQSGNPRRADLTSLVRCNGHDNTGSAFRFTYCSDIGMDDCLADDSGAYNIYIAGVEGAVLVDTVYSGTGGTVARILHVSSSTLPYFTDATAYTYYGASSGIYDNGAGPY